MRPRFALIILLLIGLMPVVGCDWWGAEDDLESELSELGVADEEMAPPLTVAPENADSQDLSLNLHVGDKFPLVKSVVQTLVQSSPQGEVTSTSGLEMLLSITVEEIPESGERAGQKRMGVKYHRVRFSQDLAGKRTDYDSDSAQGPLPIEVQGYHGLVGNGFFFWLGPDNQLVEMVGFPEFVDRCVREVAPERRDQVRTMLAANTGADGLANFVDDSIGLLPAQAVQVGDTWTRTRQIFEPLRMNVSHKYTLQAVNGQVAEVSILGTIAPSSAYTSEGESTKNVKVSVRGGRSYGSCTIDRGTGLPIISQVEQTLEMLVQVPNQPEFTQQKHTLISIRAFPEQQSAGEVAEAPSANAGDYSDGSARPNGTASTATPANYR